MNIQEMEVEDQTKVLIGIHKKSDNTKLAVTTDEYSNYDKRSWALDGIIIRNEDNDVDFLFASSEKLCTFGIGPEDIPESDKRRKNAPVSPSFNELDGYMCTQYQLANHPDTHEEGCAICEAVKFGWLPSNGELNTIIERKDKFNEVAEACGASLFSGSLYSSSTQYDKDYMWCFNTESGNFEFWHSKATQMSMRAVKSASDYEKVVE